MNEQQIQELRDDIEIFKERLGLNQVLLRGYEKQVKAIEKEIAEAESRLWIAERGITTKDVNDLGAIHKAANKNGNVASIGRIIKNLERPYFHDDGRLYKTEFPDTPTPAKYEHVPEENQ